MIFRKSFAIAAIASSLALFGCDAQKSTDEGVKVYPLSGTIAEESFQTVIINKALQELGYNVMETKEVDYSAAYTAIASGEATYMAVSWYPLHDAMYANAGGDEIFYRKGHYISGAAQGYLVDKKTADAHNITLITDLKKPGIAELFDADGDGLADMTGCQSGWGCEGVIEHQLDAFDLRGVIEHNQGLYSAVIADTIARFEAGKPVIYYSWTPYWVSGKLVPNLDVVWLEVPFSAHPNGTDTELKNGKNYGFSVNSERIVANRKWAEANPMAAKLFEVAKLPINDVSAQNMLIANGNNSPEAIESHADQWIKANRVTFDRWLDEARAAGSKK